MPVEDALKAHSRVREVTGLKRDLREVRLSDGDVSLQPRSSGKEQAPLDMSAGGLDRSPLECREAQHRLTADLCLDRAGSAGGGNPLLCAVLGAREIPEDEVKARERTEC